MEQRQQGPFGGSEKEQHTQVIPVTEEHLVVDKQVVESGKLHISKQVTQEEATVDIPVIQEGYTVERRPGSQELYMQYPNSRYEGDTLIIPIVREVAVVEKRYEITEELHISKKTTQLSQPQRVTLQKETVEVRRSSAHE